jgi:hypothetical protein
MNYFSIGVFSGFNKVIIKQPIPLFKKVIKYI